LTAYLSDRAIRDRIKAALATLTTKAGRRLQRDRRVAGPAQGGRASEPVPDRIAMR
jgi:hypothetical protein